MFVSYFAGKPLPSTSKEKERSKSPEESESSASSQSEGKNQDSSVIWDNCDAVVEIMDSEEETSDEGEDNHDEEEEEEEEEESDEEEEISSDSQDETEKIVEAKTITPSKFKKPYDVTSPQGYIVRKTFSSGSPTKKPVISPAQSESSPSKSVILPPTVAVSALAKLKQLKPVSLESVLVDVDRSENDKSLDQKVPTKDTEKNKSDSVSLPQATSLSPSVSTLSHVFIGASVSEESQADKSIPATKNDSSIDPCKNKPDLSSVSDDEDHFNQIEANNTISLVEKSDDAAVSTPSTSDQSGTESSDEQSGKNTQRSKTVKASNSGNVSPSKYTPITCSPFLKQVAELLHSVSTESNAKKSKNSPGRGLNAEIIAEIDNYNKEVEKIIESNPEQGIKSKLNNTNHVPKNVKEAKNTFDSPDPKHLISAATLPVPNVLSPLPSTPKPNKANAPEPCLSEGQVEEKILDSEGNVKNDNRERNILDTPEIVIDLDESDQCEIRSNADVETAAQNQVKTRREIQGGDAEDDDQFSHGEENNLKATSNPVKSPEVDPLQPSSKEDGNCGDTIENGKSPKSSDTANKTQTITNSPSLEQHLSDHPQMASSETDDSKQKSMLSQHKSQITDSPVLKQPLISELFKKVISPLPQTPDSKSGCTAAQNDTPSKNPSNSKLQTPEVKEVLLSATSVESKIVSPLPDTPKPEKATRTEADEHNGSKSERVVDNAIEISDSQQTSNQPVKDSHTDGSGQNAKHIEVKSEPFDSSAEVYCAKNKSIQLLDLRVVMSPLDYLVPNMMLEIAAEAKQRALLEKESSEDEMNRLSAEDGEEDGDDVQNTEISSDSDDYVEVKQNSRQVAKKSTASVSKKKFTLDSGDQDQSSNEVVDTFSEKKEDNEKEEQDDGQDTDYTSDTCDEEIPSHIEEVHAENVTEKSQETEAAISNVEDHDDDVESIDEKQMSSSGNGDDGSQSDSQVPEKNLLKGFTSFTDRVVSELASEGADVAIEINDSDEEIKSPANDMDATEPKVKNKSVNVKKPQFGFHTDTEDSNPLEVMDFKDLGCEPLDPNQKEFGTPFLKSKLKEKNLRITPLTAVDTELLKKALKDNAQPSTPKKQAVSSSPAHKVKTPASRKLPLTERESDSCIMLDEDSNLNIQSVETSPASIVDLGSPRIVNVFSLSPKKKCKSQNSTGQEELTDGKAKEGEEISPKPVRETTFEDGRKKIVRKAAIPSSRINISSVPARYTKAAVNLQDKRNIIEKTGKKKAECRVQVVHNSQGGSAVRGQKGYQIKIVKPGSHQQVQGAAALNRNPLARNSLPMLPNVAALQRAGFIPTGAGLPSANAQIPSHGQMKNTTMGGSGLPEIIRKQVQNVITKVMTEQNPVEVPDSSPAKAPGHSPRSRAALNEALTAAFDAYRKAFPGQNVSAPLLNQPKKSPVAKKSTASASKTHARRPSSPGVTFVGIEPPKSMTATKPKPSHTLSKPAAVQNQRPNIAHGRKPPNVHGNVIKVSNKGPLKTASNVVQDQRAHTGQRTNHPSIVGSVIQNRVNIDLTSPETDNVASKSENPKRAHIVHGIKHILHGIKPPTIVGGPIPNTTTNPSGNQGDDIVVLTGNSSSGVQSIDLTETSASTSNTVQNQWTGAVYTGRPSNLSANSVQSRRPRIFIGRKPTNIQQAPQSARTLTNQRVPSTHGQDHGLRTKASRTQSVNTFDKRKATSGQHFHHGALHGPHTLRKSDLGGARSYMRQAGKKKPSANSNHGKNAPRGAHPPLSSSHHRHRVTNVPQRANGEKHQANRKTTASVAHPVSATSSKDSVIVLSDSD